MGGAYIEMASFQQFTKFTSRNMSCKLNPKNPIKFVTFSTHLTGRMWYVNSDTPMHFCFAMKLHIPPQKGPKKKKQTSVTQMFVENMA